MAEWIALAGVVLGVLLGFGGELILARRQDARRLDDTRRELYAQFLSAVKLALDHLAEGTFNRLNGAIVRGEYGGTYVKDHQQLESAISGMELLSTPPVLERARALAGAHQELATHETRADVVDRDVVGDAVVAGMVEQLQDDLRRLHAINEAFLTAAQRELRLSALLGAEARD